jgi:hypothetical protein
LTDAVQRGTGVDGGESGRRVIAMHRPYCQRALEAVKGIKTLTLLGGHLAAAY